MIIKFDMTGYHPGAASMTGWLVSHYLNGDQGFSLNEILSDGAVVRIRNFHKIGHTNPGQMVAFLTDVQTLIKKGVTFEFEDDLHLERWQIGSRKE